MCLTLDSEESRRLLKEGETLFGSMVPRKTWHTIPETKGYLGISESSVHNLIADGQLACIEHNNGSGERQHRRVLRDSILTYLVLNYSLSSEDVLEHIKTVLRNRSLDDLKILRDYCSALMEEGLVR